MIIQNILLADESYTHDHWVYHEISVGFSRLYYVLDGEAYYEEKGKKVRLKPNHVYLTPVKTHFTLTENPRHKLLHTYVHITTVPTVKEFTEIRVEEGSLLADAVALWRKYIHSDEKTLTGVLELVLSCLEPHAEVTNPVAEQAKEYMDAMSEFSFDMTALSRSLGYTREHVTRCFLDAYHTTPCQYVNLRRMNVAAERLRSGAKVGEISEALGFASPYSFSKAFKRHFGLSPAHYRSTLQRDPTPSPVK